MDTKELTITTGTSRAVVDLTPQAAEFVRGRGDGLLSVFVPHRVPVVAKVVADRVRDRNHPLHSRMQPRPVFVTGGS